MCVPEDIRGESPRGATRAGRIHLAAVFQPRPDNAYTIAVEIHRLENRLHLVNRELQQLRREKRRQSASLERAYVDTIHCLLAAAEAKDPYIKGHAHKVGEVARMIGERMGFDSQSLDNLEYASLLHDVGKIGVPLEVLSKKGRLAREEMEAIKTHPEISVEIVSPVGFLERVVPIIRHHHENVNGTGYPLGLSGEQIPLEARVLAVADAYDAMVSDRPYRKPLEHWRAVEIIAERAGDAVRRRGRGGVRATGARGAADGEFTRKTKRARAV